MGVAQRMYARALFEAAREEGAVDDVSAEQLRPEASFIDDLKADSLAVVELVLAFEQEFKITIPEEDTEQIKTVKDATNYIKTHAK